MKEFLSEQFHSGENAQERKIEGVQAKVSCQTFEEIDPTIDPWSTKDKCSSCASSPVSNVPPHDLVFDHRFPPVERSHESRTIDKFPEWKPSKLFG